MPVFNYKIRDEKGVERKGVLVASGVREAELKLQARQYKIIELVEATGISSVSTQKTKDPKSTIGKGGKTLGGSSTVKTGAVPGAPGKTGRSVTGATGRGVTGTTGRGVTGTTGRGVSGMTTGGVSGMTTRGVSGMTTRGATGTVKSTGSIMKGGSTGTSMPDLGGGLKALSTPESAAKRGKAASPKGLQAHRTAFLQEEPSKRLQNFLNRFRIKTYDLLISTRQFHQMVTAGLPIVRGMSALWQNQSNPALRAILQNIHDDLHRGMSITAAFSRFPETFSPTYLAMLRVGEATGNLDDALKNIADFLEREHDMKSKITSSLTYPCFVLAIAAILLWVMIFYFVPVFIGVFEQMRVDLPLPTKFLIFFVTTFRRWEVIVPLVVLFISAIVFLIVFSRKPMISLMLDHIKLSIPVIGDTIILIALGQVLNSMAVMLRAGVPMLQTMEIITTSTTLTPLRNALTEMSRNMREGSPVSTAAADARFFSVLFKSFVAAGEESGSLPFMLESLARIYDNHITSRLETLINLMEPVLLTAISFVVGFIMISIFLPLYGVLNTLT